MSDVGKRLEQSAPTFLLREELPLVKNSASLINRDLIRRGEVGFFKLQNPAGAGRESRSGKPHQFVGRHNKNNQGVSPAKENL